MTDPFFALHSGLDREGPGEPADVAWAAATAELAQDARICDAGCGAGADVPALLTAAPQGHVTAVDNHKPFVDDVLARFGDDPRVTAYAGDMIKLKGPFDFIWCAGAIYFVGIEKALNCWRPALAKGGAVAFSEPCLFGADPSDQARAFWSGYERLTDVAGIAAQVEEAGYTLLGTRRLSDAAWEAYYGPLQARLDTLRAGAATELAKVLDEAAAEIAHWRAVKDETGYLLCVARPA
ncbi:class I SAM-dependent methyltransferase [Psychromarinibacter sp. C21-152]|uniref:Class I SAM-dependent methyltransferase n=1 Tax=Psychromarinibacter sediminicola TaxID=3033385 RepID=A0AAE3NTG6_9RHOB|nr:class I SAM-dependent methyltransferase [Psychromarinibacter sediminicola]MDF0603238.1 class I SAM-dependent methyltransferase [Psychromarinibacter sediminicola]